MSSEFGRETTGIKSFVVWTYFDPPGGGFPQDIPSRGPKARLCDGRRHYTLVKPYTRVAIILQWRGCALDRSKKRKMYIRSCEYKIIYHLRFTILNPLGKVPGGKARTRQEGWDREGVSDLVGQAHAILESSPRDL